MVVGNSAGLMDMSRSTVEGQEENMAVPVRNGP